MEEVTEKGKKVAAAGLVIIGLISLVSVLDGPQPMPKTGSPEVLAATSTLEEMPESSPYIYGVDEYRAINGLVSKGMFIRYYRMKFANLAKKDYDIEKTYTSFDADMGRYSADLKKEIISLRSMRPGTGDSQISQRETLLRAERLYELVSEYKMHERSIYDTIAYLDECAAALDVLGQQAKLPPQ